MTSCATLQRQEFSATRVPFRLGNFSGKNRVHPSFRPWGTERVGRLSLHCDNLKRKKGDVWSLACCARCSEAVKSAAGRTGNIAYFEKANYEWNYAPQPQWRCGALRRYRRRHTRYRGNADLWLRKVSILRCRRALHLRDARLVYRTTVAGILVASGEAYFWHGHSSRLHGDAGSKNHDAPCRPALACEAGLDRTRQGTLERQLATVQFRLLQQRKLRW